MNRDKGCTISGEELSRLAAGEVSPERRQVIEAHLRECDTCSKRLEQIEAADAVVKARAREPLDEIADRVLQQLGTRIRPAGEIMTLSEAADFLRLSMAEIEDRLEELPVFEVSGQIRIRRERLLAWTEQRERSFQRELMRSRAIESLQAAMAKGVAS